MNNNLLKKAFTKGMPIALAAWFGYGVIASFFDDTVFEQMFKFSGILVGLAAVAAAVGGIYHRLTANEKASAAQPAA